MLLTSQAAEYLLFCVRTRQERIPGASYSASSLAHQAMMGTMNERNLMAIDAQAKAYLHALSGKVP